MREDGRLPDVGDPNLIPPDDGVSDEWWVLCVAVDWDDELACALTPVREFSRGMPVVDDEADDLDLRNRSLLAHHVHHESECVAAAERAVLVAARQKQRSQRTALAFLTDVDLIDRMRQRTKIEDRKPTIQPTQGEEQT